MCSARLMVMSNTLTLISNSVREMGESQNEFAESLEGIAEEALKMSSIREVEVELSRTLDLNG